MYVNIKSGEVLDKTAAMHEFYKTHSWRENWESEWIAVQQ